MLGIGLRSRRQVLEFVSNERWQEQLLFGVTGLATHRAYFKPALRPYEILIEPLDSALPDPFVRPLHK